MEIVYIVSFSIIASLLYITLVELHKPIAFFLLIITGIIILLTILKYIGGVFDLIQSLADKASIDGLYLETILKIIGIAYITEIGSSITKDAGLGSVATKIELAGKIFILVLAIPIITAVIETILSFLPSA